MNKILFVLLFLALAAYGQMQERVAIINTMDDRDSMSISDLTYLTDRLREVAVNTLPSERFGVMTTESIVAFLGSMENTVKVCKEASCLAELGRKVSADFVAQGRIGRFSDNLTIKVELYNVKTGNLIGSFTGNFKDIFNVLALIDEKAPDLFKKMLKESKTAKEEPVVKEEQIIAVEKPEVAKIEPAPAPLKPEPEMPRVEEPIKTSFWVAIGLDVLGAAFISYAIYENKEMNAAYDRYNKRGQSQDYYDEARKDVNSARSSRNAFYIIGGVALASGIGVHIWF